MQLPFNVCISHLKDAALEQCFSSLQRRACPALLPPRMAYFLVSKLDGPYWFSRPNLSLSLFTLSGRNAACCRTTAAASGNMQGAEPITQHGSRVPQAQHATLPLGKGCSHAWGHWDAQTELEHKRFTRLTDKGEQNQEKAMRGSRPCYGSGACEEMGQGSGDQGRGTAAQLWEQLCLRVEQRVRLEEPGLACERQLQYLPCWSRSQVRMEPSAAGGWAQASQCP